MRIPSFLVLLVLTNACAYNERNSPWEYIKFDSEPWNGNPRIEVELINTAHHTAYGPIGVLVVYHDINGKRIGTERIGQYEVLEPGSNSLIKSVIHPPPPPVHTHTISFETEWANAIAR